MAKLPSWIVTEGWSSGIDADGRPCAVVTIRIRRWHPYVIWMLLKAAWRSRHDPA
jgi:hypothetical protein